MKKLILASVVLAIMATPVLAGPTFTIQKADLLSMTELNQSPTPDGNPISIDLTLKTDVASIFTGSGANQLTGEVGFAGNLKDGVSIPMAWIKIGLTGLSLNLSGYTDYQMVMTNDNDDLWHGALFAGGSTSSFVSLDKGQSAVLNLDLTGVGTVSSIGFFVGGFKDDTYHISVSPVPAPGALLLGSMGIGVVGWLRRRRTL